MSNQHRERIDLAPFLKWAAARQAQIARSLDAYPAMGGRGGQLGSHSGGGVSALERLAAELGWSVEHGPRRLLRWRNEGTRTAARADIENALHMAGVDFEELYPDAGQPRERPAAAVCTECSNPLILPATLCGFCIAEQWAAVDPARVAA